MARPNIRTQSCDRNAALSRLAQTEAFLLAADLLVDDDRDDATPSVAASLSVLAGIVASDAACCARLGVRARGQAHTEAVELLGSVDPGGTSMAKDLRHLLNRKDDSYYGIVLVAPTDAARMVAWAKRLLRLALRAVEA